MVQWRFSGSLVGRTEENRPSDRDLTSTPAGEFRLSAVEEWTRGEDPPILPEAAVSRGRDPEGQASIPGSSSSQLLLVVLLLFRLAPPSAGVATKQ